MFLSRFDSGAADLLNDDKVTKFADFTFLSLFCMCLCVQGCVSAVLFLDISKNVLAMKLLCFLLGNSNYSSEDDDDYNNGITYTPLLLNGEGNKKAPTGPRP